MNVGQASRLPRERVGASKASASTTKAGETPALRWRFMVRCSFSYPGLPPSCIDTGPSRAHCYRRLMNPLAASRFSRPALLGVLALGLALPSPSVFAQGDRTNQIELQTNTLEPYLLTNLYRFTNVYLPPTNLFSGTNKIVLTNIPLSGLTNMLTNGVFLPNILTGTNVYIPPPPPPPKPWWKRFWDWL